LPALYACHSLEESLKLIITNNSPENMASNQNKPLSAPSLSKFITASLPKDAEPQLKSSTDAIAVAAHAGMLAVGFRLVGLGEDHKIGNAPVWQTRSERD